MYSSWVWEWLDQLLAATELERVNCSTEHPTILQSFVVVPSMVETLSR
jgi:hypothetical protein